MPLLCATFWQPGATAITFTYHNFPATVGQKFFQLPCGSGLVPFSVSSNWYVHSAITPTWHAPFLPSLPLSLHHSSSLSLSLCLCQYHTQRWTHDRHIDTWRTKAKDMLTKHTLYLTLSASPSLYLYFSPFLPLLLASCVSLSMY